MIEDCRDQPAPKETIAKLTRPASSCRTRSSASVCAWSRARAGLDRPLRHPRVQKNGLALAGHFHGVVPTRVQVLGETELSYLESLTPRRPERRGARLLLARPVVRRRHGRQRAAARARRGGRGDEHAALRRPTRDRAARSTRSTRVLDDRLAPQTQLHGVLVDVFGVGHPPARQERHRQERVRARARDARAPPRRRRRRPLRLAAAGHGLRRGPRSSCATTSRSAASASSTSGSSSASPPSASASGSTSSCTSASGTSARSSIGSASRSATTSSSDTPIRELRVPVRPGRDMGSIIEMAARNELLRRDGRHTAHEFLDKIEGHLVDATGDRAMPTPPARRCRSGEPRGPATVVARSRRRRAAPRARRGSPPCGRARGTTSDRERPSRTPPTRPRGRRSSSSAACRARASRRRCTRSRTSASSASTTCRRSSRRRPSRSASAAG